MSYIKVNHVFEMSFRSMTF